MNDLRVLQVHNRYERPGGEDVVADYEYDALDGAGIPVDRLLVRNEQAPGWLTRVRAASRVVWSWSGYRAVREAVRASGANVVHVHNTHHRLGPSAFWAARRAGAAVVLTAHNYRVLCANAMFLREGKPCELCLHGNTVHAIRHRCYRGSRASSAAMAASLAIHHNLGTYQKAIDRLICLTEFQRRKMIEAGFSEQQLVVHGNHVSDPAGDGLEPPPSRERTVLFVGRLGSEKGAQDLLQAWAQGDRDGWRLEIIGDGLERAELERVADGRTDVLFAGWQAPDAVAHRMRKARYVVVPSRWYETYALTVSEAYAQGVPVVVPRHGVFLERVEEGRTAWTFEPGSVASLARVIDHVLALDDAEWQVASVAARRAFEAQDDAEAHLRALLAVYADALAARQMRAQRHDP